MINMKKIRDDIVALSVSQSSPAGMCSPLGMCAPMRAAARHLSCTHVGFATLAAQFHCTCRDSKHPSSGRRMRS